MLKILKVVFLCYKRIMNKLDYDAINDYISENVMKPFYEVRVEKLQSLSLTTILKRKNPYLFKAKNIETSGEFIKHILDAYLSSQEETMFGNLLEKLAIFVCADVFNGKKAEEGVLKSVDLEFVRNNKYYIVGIKSGIYWGNRDQTDRMKSNFKAAKAILREKGVKQEIVAVNGCIYGKDRKPFKENSDPELNYYKLCGQDFWELVSGDDQLYKNIILPLDKEAKKRSDLFKELYAAKSNEMIKEFSETFLTTTGSIDWEKMIDFVSKSKEI